MIGESWCCENAALAERVDRGCRRCGKQQGQSLCAMASVLTGEVDDLGKPGVKRVLMVQCIKKV